MVSQVGDDLLSLYDALRSKKKGIAVSKIEDQMCSVCGSTLTPAECQSAKSRIDIISCPTCGRILYAD
jgi:predicted  nucleic acid-binding Zn-ribbon protein